MSLLPRVAPFVCVNTHSLAPRFCLSGLWCDSCVLPHVTFSLRLVSPLFLVSFSFVFLLHVRCSSAASCKCAIGDSEAMTITEADTKGRGTEGRGGGPNEAGNAGPRSFCHAKGRHNRAGPCQCVPYMCFWIFSLVIERARRTLGTSPADTDPTLSF